MKRRGFIKGFLGAVTAAPLIAKGLIKEPVKTRTEWVNIESEADCFELCVVMGKGAWQDSNPVREIEFATGDQWSDKEFFRAALPGRPTPVFNMIKRRNGVL